MYFRRSRNRYHPRLLSEDPREGDLRRRSASALSNCVEQLDNCPICLPRLRRKARHSVPKVCAVKRGAVVDLSREVALPEGAKRNKANSQLFKRRNDISLRLPPPK